MILTKHSISPVNLETSSVVLCPGILSMTDEQTTLEAVKFNADGLVPAIAQDAISGQVLMMAWMNKDSLSETIRTGRACYWSRSRQSFWRKGDTSGHIQTVKSLQVDCDGDTILIQVEQVGAACHTGKRSCFFQQIAMEDSSTG